jgi:hypothetical protein
MCRSPIKIFSILLLLAGPFSKTEADENPPKSCLKCHQGIESIGEVHLELFCEDCHQGDQGGFTKETAHVGLYKNPGDLKIVEKTCGEMP